MDAPGSPSQPHAGSQLHQHDDGGLGAGAGALQQQQDDLVGAALKQQLVTAMQQFMEQEVAPRSAAITQVHAGAPCADGHMHSSAARCGCCTRH